MAKENQNNKSKIGILFAVLIPLFLLLVAGVVIFFMLTSDSDNWVKNTASKIPIISSVISPEGQKEKDTQAKLDKANEKIVSQKEEIEDLKKEIASLEGIMEDQN